MHQSEQHQQPKEEIKHPDQPRENVPTVSRNVQQRGQFLMNRSPAQSAVFPPRPSTSFSHDRQDEQSTHERRERARSRSPRSDEQPAQHRCHLGASCKKFKNVTIPIPRATNKNPNGAPKEQGDHRGNLSEVPTQLSHRDDNQHDERRRARVAVDDPGNRRPFQVLDSGDSELIVRRSTGVRFDLLNAADEKVVLEFKNVIATYELTQIHVKQNKHN